MQITFTLDPDEYHRLQTEAEKNNMTISSFVRERVLKILKNIKHEETLRIQ